MGLWDVRFFFEDNEEGQAETRGGEDAFYEILCEGDLRLQDLLSSGNARETERERERRARARVKVRTQSVNLRGKTENFFFGREKKSRNSSIS